MSRTVRIKDIAIGGNNKIALQSMTNTKTSDIDKTLIQIKQLEQAGCDIVRVAVPDFSCAKAVKDIVKNIKIPLVADIHFDFKLAIESIKNGANKIRFNPGNIGSQQNVRYLVDCAKDYKVPIRVGVNSGSVDKAIKDKYSSKTEQLVESALEHVRLLEKMSFYDIVLSVKSSCVKTTVEAYELLASKTDYPLHLGVTEAGTKEMGEIKSAIGIGSLLLKGIGDTVRVSLTGNPVDEIFAAKKILKSLDLIKHVNVVSCPTCGRCNVDLKGIADKVIDITKDIEKPLKIAVMGCVVNGPGEAEDADLGIAGGKDKVALFKNGKVIKTLPMDDALEEFKKELDILLNG